MCFDGSVVTHVSSEEHQLSPLLPPSDFLPSMFSLYHRFLSKGRGEIKGMARVLGMRGREVARVCVKSPLK